MLSPDVIEINDEQAQKAKALSSPLSEAHIRKRAMIDMLGINCVIGYLYSKQIAIDTKRSIYKIPKLYEEFKINDIYYNNYRIDVITLYQEKTVRIPKSHNDDDILPHFYFVVQIGSRIKEAKMIGFMDAQKVIKSPHDSNYYYPALNLVFDVERFKSKTKRPIAPKPLLGKHSDCLGLFLKFIDNDLSSIYKRQLIHHIINCDSCRTNFIDMMEFERIGRSVRKYPELIEKYNRKKAKKISNAALSSQTEIKSKFEDLENSQSPITSTRYTKEEKLSKNTRRYNDGANLEQKMQSNNDIQEKRQIKNNDEIRKEIKLEVQKEVELQTMNASNEENILQEENSAAVIEEIFDEAPKFELPSLTALIGNKNKRHILILAAILLFLGIFVAISTKGALENFRQQQNETETEYNNQSQEYYEDDFYDEDDYQTNAPSNGQAILIPKNNGARSIDDFIIKQPVSTKPTYSPTVTKVSWEAPESLIKKEDYTRFLQLTGKNIKLNLQNDMLLINDVPANKIVKVDIRIASSGDIRSVRVSKTSGSEQIDALIKKVAKDTLKYMKPPSHGIISRPVEITLSVELY